MQLIPVKLLIVSVFVRKLLVYIAIELTLELWISGNTRRPSPSKKRREETWKRWAVKFGTTKVDIATVLKFAKLMFIVFAEIKELIYILTELMLLVVMVVVMTFVVLIVEAFIKKTFAFCVTILFAIKELAFTVMLDTLDVCISGIRTNPSPSKKRREEIRRL